MTIIFISWIRFMRLIYMYLLLLIIIVPVGMLWFSRWQSEATADCSLVESRSDIRITPDAELFPQDAISRASKNLRSYCCEQKILRNTDKVTICDPSDVPANKYFPQSAYLFDHIIDIMLRRLDGNESLIYPDVSVHPQWKSRREGMRNYASNPLWAAPLTIINFIQPYRYDDKNNPNQLIDLYTRSCETAFNLYKSVAGNSPWASATRRILDNGTCTTIVQEQIQYELLYARTVINLLANQSLRTYFTNNLNDYYVNNRLIRLQSTISEMIGAFTTVNRFVVEWTKMCSM
jgi:hypothetical protein